jgi:cytoskeleton protein RodZ
MSLEALERSDLSRLPGGIFTRAFVRAYAQEVGLDPDRTIQEFIAELPPEAATTTARHARIEDGEKLDSDRRAVATAFRLALISLPIIALVIYYGTKTSRGSDPAPEPPAESQPPATNVPSEMYPMVAAPAAPLNGTTSELTIEISPRATCWVSVNVDGEQGFSGLMRAGDKQIVKAREHVVLNVGDAGAFVYVLNGRAGKPLGGPGEVVSTRISRTNVQEFQNP